MAAASNARMPGPSMPRLTKAAPVGGLTRRSEGTRMRAASEGEASSSDGATELYHHTGGGPALLAADISRHSESLHRVHPSGGPSSIERGEVMSVPSVPRKTRGLFAMLVVAVCGVAAAATGATATAAESTKSYIVVMEASPAVAYEGGVAGIPATKPGKGKKINPRQRERQALPGSSREEPRRRRSRRSARARTTKLNDYSISLNGYSALLHRAQAAASKAARASRWSWRIELQQPTTDSSPAFLGLTGAGGAYRAGDQRQRRRRRRHRHRASGPSIPSFAGAGFPAPPTGAAAVCNFGNTAHNPNDAPFTCNNKLIGARQMLATYRALIGAAARRVQLGAGRQRPRDAHRHRRRPEMPASRRPSSGLRGGQISGIAPRAHVIAYKGLGNLRRLHVRPGRRHRPGRCRRRRRDQLLDRQHVLQRRSAPTRSRSCSRPTRACSSPTRPETTARAAARSSARPTSPWLTSVGASTQSRFFQGNVVLGNGASYPGASITPGIATPKPLARRCGPRQPALQSGDARSRAASSTRSSSASAASSAAWRRASRCSTPAESA